MIIALFVLGYLVIALFGIFVVTPYAKANRWIGFNDPDDPKRWNEHELYVLGSIFWFLLIPIVAIVALCYYPAIFIYKHSCALSDKMVVLFTPKPPIIPPPPEVDEAKSTYRNFSLK